MRGITSLLVLLALGASAFGQASDRLTCRLGDRQVFESQETLYEVMLRGGDEKVTFTEPPAVEGLRFALVNAGTRGTRTIIINGRRSDYTDWAAVWRITAEKPGRFEIEPPKVTSGGRDVSGNSVTLIVAPVPQQDLARVELTVDDQSPVVGQAVGLTVDVLLKHLPAPSPEPDPLYYHAPRSRMAAPELLVPWLPKPPEPFSEAAFDAGAWGRQVMGSRDQGLRIGGFGGRVGFLGEVADVRRADDSGAQSRYRRYRFHVVLRAARAGSFEIPRAILEGDLANKVGGGFRPTSVFARSDPLLLTVTEPSSTDRPEAWTGAVGRFELEAQPPTPTVVNVGSPIYMTVVVKGEGFLDGVALDLAGQLGSDWRVDAPKVIDSLKPGEERPEGFPSRPGTWRQFDFKLRPLVASLEAVPAVSFTYFDTKTKAYATVMSEPFPIEVRSSGVGVDEGVVDATGGKKSATELVASGLSANEDDLNKLGDQAVAAWPFLVVGLGLLPLWALTGAVVSRRRALLADPAILRRKNARVRASKSLRQARGESPEVGVRTAVAALRGLVADLEDRPDDAVTSGDVSSWLASQGVDGEVEALIGKLLEAGEALAFGGGSLDPSEWVRALDAADSVVASKVRRGRGATGLLLFMCTFSPTVAAQDMDLFQKAQEAFADGRYEESAALYERMLGGEYENGYVLYNLGNAWLQAGEIGRALAAYRRAAWLLPGDANLDRNLAIALDRRRQTLDEGGGAVIDKILFWRPHLSFAAQAWGALIALVLAITLSLARTLLARQVAGGRAATLIFLGVAVLLVTSATVTRVDQTARDHGAVTEDETRLLQWPSSDADLSYEQPLHDGDEFSVVSRRDGWLKVRVADRYEGWIEEARAVTW